MFPLYLVVDISTDIFFGIYFYFYGKYLWMRNSIEKYSTK